MWKHIRGESTVTKQLVQILQRKNKTEVKSYRYKQLAIQNVCHKQLHDNTDSSQQFRGNIESIHRSKVKQLHGITVQVNNFAGILDQIIDQNSNVCTEITVQVNNFAEEQLMSSIKIQTIAQE